MHRPGQVVALDTTVLAVKVRETVFAEPVSAHLTLALDVYTHSLVAFRLTLVSDTSVDVAMILRDVMMPLPLRPEWGEDMEWPYPGVPAAVVAEFAGHRVAGLPFFTPETITTDHGSVYKNHHLVEVQRVIGANVLPARSRRGWCGCGRTGGSASTPRAGIRPVITARTRCSPPRWRRAVSPFRSPHRSCSTSCFPRTTSRSTPVAGSRSAACGSTGLRWTRIEAGLRCAVDGTREGG
jgi:hypothetical protein